ncbi:MAG: hypothetical protein ACE5K7_06020, partial [Phycisphaerae bacterium]
DILFSSVAAGAVTAQAGWVQAVVIQRGTCAVLLVHRYHARTGRWPKTLSGVAKAPHSEVAVDPYTGEAFIYRPAAPGFTLYSVGADRDDDGGRHDRAALWVSRVRPGASQAEPVSDGDYVFWPLQRRSD